MSLMLGTVIRVTFGNSDSAWTLPNGCSFRKFIVDFYRNFRKLLTVWGVHLHALSHHEYIDVPPTHRHRSTATQPSSTSLGQSRAM